MSREVEVRRVLVDVAGARVARVHDLLPVQKVERVGKLIPPANLGIGRGAATVWSCDLTHGYIDINGGYRS